MQQREATTDSRHRLFRRAYYEQERTLHGDCGWRQQLVRRTIDFAVDKIVTATPAPPVDRPYRVVALLGQSNAHGAGALAPGAAPIPVDPRVHQWAGCGRRRNSICLAAEPLLHGIPGAGVGFGTTFGGLLAEQTGDPVLQVPCARGDTSFYPKNRHSWDPDDTTTAVNLFDNAVRRIDAALTATGAPLGAVLWHQGESDAPMLPPEVYASKLDLLIHRIQQRYGPVPFLIGQMVPEWIENGHEMTPGIDAVHREMPARHDNAVFVSGPRGMFNGPQEQIHYNADGAQEMGRRMFAAWRGLDCVS